MKKIEIYTSDTCVQCKMAKEYKRELIKKGYLSVPVIVIDGQDVLGFDLTRIEQLTGVEA